MVVRRTGKIRYYLCTLGLISEQVLFMKVTNLPVLSLPPAYVYVVAASRPIKSNLR